MRRFLLLFALVGLVAAPNSALAGGGPLSLYSPFSEHAMRVARDGFPKGYCPGWLDSSR